MYRSLSVHHYKPHGKPSEVNVYDITNDEILLSVSVEEALFIAKGLLHAANEEPTTDIKVGL